MLVGGKMSTQWESVTILTAMLMQMQHDQDYFVEQFTKNPKWADWASRLVLCAEARFYCNLEDGSFTDDMQEFLDFIDDNGFIVTYSADFASVVKEDAEC